MQSGTKKHDHIDPVIASLHWLTGHFRIQFKTLLITWSEWSGPILQLTSLFAKNEIHQCIRKALGFNMLEDNQCKATKLWSRWPDWRIKINLCSMLKHSAFDWHFRSCTRACPIKKGLIFFT